MRRVFAAVVALLSARARLRPVLSEPPDPHHRADAGRRPGRRDGAAHRQRAAGEPRAERLRREQAGRRQHARLAAGRRSRARRLHADGLGGERPDHEPDDHSRPPATMPSSFAPVALIAETPQVLVVNPQLPVKTVAELVAYAKANPGKLNYSTGGIGTLPHLVGRAVQADHRHQYRARALQRRRTGAHRRGGRRSADDLRHGRHLAAADRATANCACSPSSDPSASPNCPTCRPCAEQGFPTVIDRRLDRAAGAERHAARHHRQAQRRRERRRSMPSR